MQHSIELRARLWRLLFVVGLATLAIFSVWRLVSVAHAAPFDPPGVGYLDFTYTGTLVTDPTGDKPESKLWWNDGFWWGSLYNRDVDAYHIYRLDWGTQTWSDTGVALDDRRESRADTLWDAASNKLYVVSHLYTENAGHINGPENWGRLYRYSYDAAMQTYSLDGGFPVTVNEDRTETLVLAKDSTNRLWVTYVARQQSTNDYQVYVNATTASVSGSLILYDDLSWGTPFTLPLTGTHVATDDIASIVSFRDNGGDKIGVMWSNQLSNTLNFATHDDTNPITQTGWTLQAAVSAPESSDDHISLRSLQTTSSGQMFAAIKTSATVPSDTLIALVARDVDGSFSVHPYSTRADNDTRPILLIDEDAGKVYIFVVGKPGGSKICYKSADITTPLANMSFPSGNCGTSFIDDGVYDQVNNPTSAKHNMNSTTGIVVLAADDDNGGVYVHNFLGNPPPVVTDRSPDRGATNVPVASTVRATFSKPMNAPTLNTTNFSVVRSGGSVAGTVGYDIATRVATFTPTTLLRANTLHTVTLSAAIQDSTDLPLFGAPEVWSFTTEPPTVQFSAATYNVNEGAGSATITVTLNATSSLPVTVTYSAGDGTAVSPDDYTAVTNTLTFDPGQTSRTFSVSIVNDLTDEPNETINLALSSLVGATPGTPLSATLTIVDNDSQPTVQFSPTTYNAGEGDGSALINVALGGTTSAFTIEVDYATTISGTATADSDYTALSGTLIFTPGETGQSFPLAILGDTLDEVGETVVLTLSNPVSATLGVGGDVATLTIVDDDAPPTVQFSSSAYSVSESGGTATITATLSAASSLPITVTYATSDGNATAGSDYTAISGTLAFAPSDISQTFSVSILPDALDEEDETVNLTLSDPVNATPGTPVAATLTIVDNDPEPTVQFSAASYSMDESAGIATITVTLSAPSGRSVSVDFATGDGTATAGSDYVGTSGTLDFPLGQTNQTFTVTILPDALDEPNETINLTLSDPNDAQLGGPVSATLTLIDDDAPPSVQLSDSAYSIGESGGTAFITVTLSAESGQTVTVNFATTGVTAIAGSDYVPISTTLAFAPGQTSQSFGVTILDDPLDEPNETVFLGLSSPGNATLGGPSGATLTIVDNDAPPSVRFSNSAYSVNENVGTATITVTLSTASGQSVSVDYATSGGSATAGNDYVVVSDTLTLDPGQTSRSFSVPIVNDTLDEPSETVNLALSNPVNATAGVPFTAVLTIDDDEAPTVQFTSSVYSVDESAGTATITVTLSVPSVFTATVNYATSNGTASAGSDYQTATGTLTFAPGQISQSFGVTILDDPLDESDETVFLGLSSPDNATLGGPSGATLTILDNDAPPAVRFSNSSYNVNENQGTAAITVTLSTASGQSVSVDYATSDGSATAGADYVVVSDTLTFAPGETSKSFTVTIINDPLDEDNETVNLTLSNPVNATPGAPDAATLTIVDDEAPTVQFASSVYSVDESAGTATITVTLSVPSVFTATVDYATSNGTALAGSDYTPVSDTLTFAPGQTSRTFSVPILSDILFEPGETINLTLSGPNGAALGSPASATLTILDDDYGIFMPIVLNASP